MRTVFPEPVFPAKTGGVIRSNEAQRIFSGATFQQQDQGFVRYKSWKSLLPEPCFIGVFCKLYPKIGKLTIRGKWTIKKAAPIECAVFSVDLPGLIIRCFARFRSSGWFMPIRTSRIPAAILAPIPACSGGRFDFDAESDEVTILIDIPANINR
jgi:hypothetical protein